MRPKSSALYRLRCEVSGRIRDRAIVARQPSSGTALEEGILKSVETVVAFPGHKFVGMFHTADNFEDARKLRKKKECEEPYHSATTSEPDGLSFAMFCYNYLCKLRGPAWAVGNYSTSLPTKGTLKKHSTEHGEQ